MSSRRWVRATAVALFAGLLIPTGINHRTDDRLHAAAAQSAPTTWAAARDTNPATVKIDVFGDSISTGFGCDHSYNCWVYRAHWEWPDIANHSRNGASATDYLPGGRWPETVAALDQLAARQPALAILITGAVDVGFLGRTTAQYIAGERNLADAIRQRSPATTLLFVHTNGFCCRQADWVDFGRQLEALANSYPNAGYYDAARDMPWADSDTSGSYLAEENPKLHPNKAGQVELAIGIIGRLRWL